MQLAGRPSDPTKCYRMRIHIANGYHYGSTLVNEVKDGKSRQNYKHWGTLDANMVFTPNLEFTMMPLEERKKYIFPAEWNTESVQKINEAAELAEKYKKSGAPPGGNLTTCAVSNSEERKIFNPESQYNNRLYGHVWLLEKIAEQKSVIEDLRITFDNNDEVVKEILTLAMYPYLTQHSFNRLEKWQNTNKAPTENVMSESYITRLTQRITNDHKMTFLKLRIKRQPSGAFAACDSTTRSAWGKCLADIHWGYNKDNPTLQNTVEIVVYSLTTHEPVYYTTYQGNALDSRTLRTIVSDLDALGVKELIIIFDRGYGSDVNYYELYENNIPFLICAKVGTRPVLPLIKTIKYSDCFGGIPLNMKKTEDAYNEYHVQLDASEQELELGDGRIVKIPGLKCNLYLRMNKRIEELDELYNTIKKEKEIWDRQTALMDETKVTREQLKRACTGFKYHKATIIKEKKDRSGNVISPQSVEFSEKSEAIENAKAIAGFHASVAYNVPGEDAMIHHEYYCLRDEQEKYFNDMKVSMDFDTQDCSSEDGKAGRLFCLFVGLILSSTLKYVWKTTAGLRHCYPTVKSILDEMRPIRFANYPDPEHPTHMTEFFKPQVEICDAFEIEVPFDCLSKSEQEKRSPKRKSGRRKTTTPAPNKSSN